MRNFFTRITFGTAVAMLSSMPVHAQWSPTTTSTGQSIGRAGNVGIGIIDPMQRLHVVGSSSEGAVLVAPLNTVNADSKVILAEDWDNTYGMNITYDGGVNRMLVFGKSGSNVYGPHLSIQRNSGFMGIGTENPGAKLELKDGMFRFNNSADNKKWEMGYSNPNDYFYIDEYGTARHFKIHNGGDVVIGSRRAAGYRLSVDGKIMCEELQVALKTLWPDYVFQNEYPLRSLEELEHFIEVKGHLPGIPKADRVQREGIALGEMQAMLLEKIEELTLYVIELNRRNAELEARIEHLGKR